MALFYDQQANAPEGDADEGVAAAAAAASGPSAGASSSSSQQPGRSNAGNRPKQMSFRDLQRADEEDDDEEDDKAQDLFAGGEKSGLAVQNPDQPANHFRNIMNQARQNRERPPAANEEDEGAPPRRNNFTGPAQTLGGDDAPSRVIQDPQAAAGRPGRRTLPRVTRTLHLWQDGVSVDDGPLFRFDDPANAHILQEINQGRAPKSLLDVEPDQEVDLNLEPHKGENYVAPKKKYKPFSGQGQRLGSPTPGIGSSSSASASGSAQAGPSSSSAGSSATSAPQVSVDDSQPTLQLQIRLGDGTRLVSRFNTTHTIGDVYEFVNRASTESQSRTYVLQTTFPPTEFSDRAKVLGDIGDFKRGGVLVQKWK